MFAVEESPTEPSNDPLGIVLSPHEFAAALLQLDGCRSAQALCDAAAGTGEAFLGPTAAALLTAAGDGVSVRPLAAVGPLHGRWPSALPDPSLADLESLYKRHGGRARVRAMRGDSIERMLSADALSELTDRTGCVSTALAPVAVENVVLGGVMLLVMSEVTAPALESLARETATAAARLLAAEQQEELVGRDAETHLLDRATFDQRATAAMTRARRFRLPLTLLLIEPSAEGRTALAVLAELVRAHVRRTDIVGRYDEGHIAVLLTETGPDGGHACAGRLLSFTRVVAVRRASFPSDGQTWSALLGHANRQRTA